MKILIDYNFNYTQAVVDRTQEDPYLYMFVLSTYTYIQTYTYL